MFFLSVGGGLCPAGQSAFFFPALDVSLERLKAIIRSCFYRLPAVAGQQEVGVVGIGVTKLQKQYKQQKQDESCFFEA